MFRFPSCTLVSFVVKALGFTPKPLTTKDTNVHEVAPQLTANSRALPRTTDPTLQSMCIPTA
jgi:hypothetical protein